MGNELEIFLWIGGSCAFYLWFSNRIRRAHSQIRYEEFQKEFTAIYGDFAFVALSMKDYENLVLNVADIKRYLEQQKEIIVYYEKAVSEEKTDGADD